MKTNLHTIYFLCSDQHRGPAALSGPLPVNKTHYDRKMTMFSRQLIYESTADDVFWVLHTKLQGKNQAAWCEHTGKSQEKPINAQKEVVCPF